MTEPKANITDSLKKLQEIVDWFESQEQVDVEAGLVKVREAAKLIKTSKARLTSIENEFREIEKEIEDSTPEIDDEPEIPLSAKVKTTETEVEIADKPINLDDIPF